MLQFAVETAYRAGRSTLAFFNNGVDVELKRDRSPVTAADLQAERIVREAIFKRYPEHGILGEEEGEGGDRSKRWVVDPIDGTKSFICGVPLYATLIAYEEDQEPVVAACYFPALDEMLYAERGQGAFWNGRRASVSTQTHLGSSVLCSGSHVSMERKGRSRGFADLAEQCLATRTWCDAYGHSLVATGRVEAMLDPVVAYWDIAAMDLIVREAGGSFTDFSGKPGRAQEAISSNGLLHARIVEAFAP